MNSVTDSNHLPISTHFCVDARSINLKHAESIQGGCSQIVLRLIPLGTRYICKSFLTIFYLYTFLLILAKRVRPPHTNDTSQYPSIAGANNCPKVHPKSAKRSILFAMCAYLYSTCYRNRSTRKKLVL